MSAFPASAETAVNFDGCPAEIHVAIAEYCSTRDVRSLCATSKRLFAHCLPVLYRHVDLSFHNRGNLNFTYRRGTQMDYEFCDPSEIPIPTQTTPRGINIAFELYNRFEKMSSTQPKQANFLKTMLAHPEYAPYVRSLSWTLLSWNHELPISIQLKEGIQQQMKQVWNVLGTLHNVKTLDLAYLSNHLNTDLSRQCPAVLFFNATSIRLQGMMEHYLATSILHSIDPAKLTHLCLDNLYDCGRKGPFVRYDGQWHADNEEVGRGSYLVDQGRQAPGPMSGLLGELEGRCTALKSLTLRTKLDWYEQSNPFALRDNTVYAEWAHFLQSVRNTLECFQFEQRPKVVSPQRVSASPSSNVVFLNVFYLDLDFLETIFQVLLQVGDWPRLKALNLKGVGPFSHNTEVGEQMRRKLRAKIGWGMLVDFNVMTF